MTMAIMVGYSGNYGTIGYGSSGYTGTYAREPEYFLDYWLW